MSIVVRYIRLKQAESVRAAEDPQWLRAFVDEAEERESERLLAPGDRRCHDTGKAWDALRFLLERRSFPVDLVHGEGELPGAGDWGYGPPRYLAADRVALAAAELEAVPFPALVGGLVPADLAEAGVYPAGLWKDPHAWEFVSAHHADLTRFLRVTARYRQGLLVRAV
ncbi:DUF1877 family protein [Kitasatospora sp. NPDC054939]